MRRMIAGALALCLFGGLAWALASRDRVQEQAARLSLDFDRSRDEVERLRADLRAVRHRANADLDAERRAKRRWRDRFVDLRWELRAERALSRRVIGLQDAIAPLRSPLLSAYVTDSTNGTRLLVASWGRVLQIWKLTSSPGGGMDEIDWQLVHEIVADVESMSITIRTQLGEARERSDIGYVGASTTAVHDLTGDGLRDFVIQAGGTGTGGCGTVWVLENADPLREIFEREDCEHFVAAKKGLLVYDDAREPKGCPNIHGCGSRTTWLRWNGDSWETVRTTTRPT